MTLILLLLGLWLAVVVCSALWLLLTPFSESSYDHNRLSRDNLQRRHLRRTFWR